MPKIYKVTLSFLPRPPYLLQDRKRLPVRQTLSMGRVAIKKPCQDGQDFFIQCIVDNRLGHEWNGPYEMFHTFDRCIDIHRKDQQKEKKDYGITKTAHI